MNPGKSSAVVLGALVGSVVLMALAFSGAALGSRFGVVLATAGLLINIIFIIFLWKTLTTFGTRCADLENRAVEDQTRAALLQAALDGIDDGILIVDGAGQTLASNQAFNRMWGFPEGRAVDAGTLLASLRDQLKDPEGCFAKARELQAAPRSSGYDLMDLWDGRVFERHSCPLDAGAARLWRLRDVTARAKADSFVQRLSQAVEQSPISIVITDTAGNLEFVNARFTQLTGYELEEALGQNLRLLQSGLTPPKVFEEMWSTITTGSVWVGEFQNRKKDGEVFHERATISPLRDADGVITHYLGLKEDITPQKELERQLRHAQKLETVGLLAGGIAHDFNNLLQVINGYGSLIQMGQAPDDPHRRSLAEILNAAERAAQLTHSLLAFSRKQAMNAKTLDLNKVVANVQKFLKRIIGEDVKLQVACVPEPLLVHADLGHIEQVLLNLATNARDAMPKGGALTITTALFHLDERFRGYHGYGRPGAYALLQVKDSGEGMDEDTLKRIFAPFFTTKELGRGTGLGLAMVYGTVKQNGGYIDVSSAVGEGSTFSVYLPIVTSPLSEQDAPASQAVAGTETILVVEDEPGVRGVVELVLKKYGYQVLLAEDGLEAVERFRAHGEEIGLVLMDIIMPRMGGNQAYEEIAKLRPGAKVLFTSGYTADFIKTRGELGQGQELIMKPVQPLALLRKIREILDR